MEKLSTIDESLADSDEDLFLGVDVAEYFGGDTFSSAVRVEVSQLKYSTRHPKQAWTADRLTRAKRGASVIRRLAAIYQGFIQENSREAVVQKLRIRLISNQPAASNLKEALIAAQEILAQESLNITTLINRLKLEHQKVIKTLSDKAALKKAEVSDFVRVLDLSGCGESPRQWQRLMLSKELSAHIKDDPVVAALRARPDNGRFTRRTSRMKRRPSSGLSVLKKPPNG